MSDPFATEQEQRGGTLAAAAILALTAVLALAWSHVRLMWNDEFLSFWGDSSESLRQVFQIQFHSPISLDPPTYHLLSHLGMDVLGRTATALRLPALAGFLLLQVCLFLLVRRLAGARAGTVAMLFPLCTASFRYSVEGRPYGFLLGLYAATLLFWFVAASRDRDRLLPLAGLAASIALAVTSHYFGVLILFPVVAGEIARTVLRRKFDWPMLAALFAGLCSVGLIVPFKQALLPYQQHYYTKAVNLRKVSQGYREIFLNYSQFPILLQRVCAVLLLVATVALAIAAWRTFRRGEGSSVSAARTLWIALWWALLAFAALPFLGYLFGRFVTHTMEVRYVMAALIFFAVALALVLAPRLGSNRWFYTIVGGMLATSIVAAAVQIRAEQRKSAAILAGLAAPAALHDEFAAHPQERLYTQSLNDFFLNSYYAPDPLIRQRMTLLYDEPLEVHYLHHNTNAVTAVYLTRFTPLAVADWATLPQNPVLLLNYHTGWEWIGKAMTAEGRPQQSLGTTLRNGELLRVGR